MFDQFSSDPQENLLSSVGLAALKSNLSPENAVIVPTSGLSTEQNLNQPVTVNPADSLLLSGIGGSDTTGAVTLVDNQSSDALTGEAMNIAKGKLIELAQSPDFIAKMNVPFGENWNSEVANTLKQNWLNGDFSFMPPIEIVAKGEIAGANGAFAQATNTIYLSQKFLRENGTNSQAVADVLLEEIGHSIDSKINVTDSPGDEGEIFAGIVQGNEWSHEELVSLKSQEDSLFINLHGQDISIEQAIDYDNRWRVWAYKNDNSGKITPLKTPSGYSSWLANNTFTSGNKGYSRDWRSGSPLSTVPQDYFMLDLRTKADFQQGQTYEFKVRADDFYRLRAIPANGVNSENLTTTNGQELITEWKSNSDAYATKTIKFVPKQTGKYWIQGWYQEVTGDASVYIAWDRNTVTVENQTFPVELLLYNQQGENLGRARRNNIDPNKDTIVVIHGRGNGTPDGNIINLATEAAKSNYYPNSQVLYLDWKEAANDPGQMVTSTPYDAAKRIRPVAQWAVEKLKKLGITPAKTILLGHSLGSYVASEIGRLGGGKVKELVALDPAFPATAPFINYDIDGNNPGNDAQIDFNTVATKSIALVASEDGLSGIAGDNSKALTAETSYLVDFNSYQGTDSMTDYHKAVVGVFSDILSTRSNSYYNLPDNQIFSAVFSNTGLFKKDSYEGGYEAIISVDLTNNNNPRIESLDYVEDSPFGLAVQTIPFHQ